MRKMQHLTSNENVDNQFIDKNVIYTKQWSPVLCVGYLYAI